MFRLGLRVWDNPGKSNSRSRSSCPAKCSIVNRVVNCRSESPGRFLPMATIAPRRYLIVLSCLLQIDRTYLRREGECLLRYR